MTAAADLARQRKRCPECGAPTRKARNHNPERDGANIEWEWETCSQYGPTCDWDDIENAREVPRGRKRSA